MRLLRVRPVRRGRDWTRGVAPTIVHVMVNFVETLFGLTIVLAVIALVLRLRRRRGARRAGTAALVIGVVAVALEIYLQLST